MPESSQEARYRANVQGEVDGAHLYRTLAEVESNPRIAEIYSRLAAVEDGHNRRTVRFAEVDVRPNLSNLSTSRPEQLPTFTF